MKTVCLFLEYFPVFILDLMDKFCQVKFQPYCGNFKKYFFLLRIGSWMESLSKEHVMGLQRKMAPVFITINV